MKSHAGHENSTAPKLLRKGDIVLIVAILALSGCAAYFAAHTGAYAADAKVQITVGGALYGTYALNETREIAIHENYENTIVIEKDAGGEMCVRVADANCPGRDCVHYAPIKLTGQSIVCLPNGLSVEIIGGNRDFDAYTY